MTAKSVDERFLGTWRLVGVDREEVETGRKLDTNVVQTGYISYTPDGRMMVIISRSEPGKPEAINCYGAQWRVEGDHVLHDVDIAARADWRGTRQVRGFRFHGDRLTLSPPVSPDFMHGSVTRRSLEWQKV
jgi:Lipocalin-like domain